MIAQNSSIESFLRLCEEMGSYPFETPMVSLK